MNPQEQSTIGCVTDPAAGAVAHDAARRPEPMGRSACGSPARAGADCHETWQPLGSRTQLPHTVFPGTARLLCSCQVIGPRLAVAILHIPARATTRDGSHPVQHHDCHTSLDEVPCTNPSQSKTDPALERAPHTRRTGPTLTNLGTGPTGSRASATSHRGNPASNDLTCHVAWHNPRSHT